MENFKSSELSAFLSRFSPFLKELKKRIYLTLFVFVTAMVFGFFFYEKIIIVLINVLSLEGVNIVFTSPFQFINLAFGCGIATGILITLPLLIAQILLFLKPALKVKEFRMVTRFLPYSILLFAVGFIFGALIMKWQIEIFLDRSIALGIGNVLDISGLLTTVLLTSVLMGVGFQFPIILLLLLRLGVIDHKKLSSKRLWVYLGSFIFALFLPPDSILADVLLALPLILLFEFTLILNRILGRKK